MKGLILILFFLVHQACCMGQFRFHHFDIEDGLSQNSVTDIFQDSEGYLWLATQDGLSQYDGRSFKNYNVSSDPTRSLSDNFLWALDEDANGNIWVGSRIGLNRINKSTGTCVRYYLQSPDSTKLMGQSVVTVAYFNEQIYAAFNRGLYLIDPAVHPDSSRVVIDESSRVLMEGDRIAVGLMKDTVSMTLYAIHVDGITNLTTLQYFPFPEGFEPGKQGFYQSTQAANGTLWWTNTANVFYMKQGSTTIQRFAFDFADEIVYDLAYCNGNLWVGTINGIYVFDRFRLLHHIKKPEDSKRGLSFNAVASLLEDRQGKMWIGTAGKGLHVYNPHQEKFKFIDDRLLGKNQIPRSVVQTPGHKMIVATNEALWLFRLKAHQHLTNYTFASDAIVERKEIFVEGMEELNASYITTGFNGDVLVGTSGNGLIVLDSTLRKKTIVRFETDNMYSNVVSDVVPLADTAVLVTTFYGVFLLDLNYQVIRSYLQELDGPYDSNYYLDAYVDAEHQLWLGSNVGCFQLDLSTGTFTPYRYDKSNLKHSPGFYFVSGFVDMGNGELWMATYGGGISCLNKASGLFTHYTVEHGLSSNVCNSIVKDLDGNLWVSTNYGISKFTIATATFDNYYTNDGVNFNEFNMHAFYTNAAGEIFFGGPNSLTIFHPAQVKPSSFQSNTIISEVSINYAQANHRLQHNEIHLYPSDRTITFNFTGFNYSRSPRVRYKYLLEGYDTGWIELDDNTWRANYTSLPPGEYVFKATCTNEDGVWSNQQAQVFLVVHPPFYNTWWFITLVVIVVLVIVVLIVRYFAQRKMKQRLQALKLQQKIQEEKQRISRDLHDNIGSEITLLISSIDQQHHGNANAKGWKELGKNARKMMAQLRQTIWVMNKECILLKDFKQKATDHLVRMLENTAIRHEVTLRGDMNAELSPAVAMHLFRIIQEAVNNTIKHAEASSFQVHFSSNNKLLHITIQDDGIGFDTTQSTNGHFGLKNMHDRTVELNGTFNISAEQGKGTIIELHIPGNK